MIFYGLLKDFYQLKNYQMIEQSDFR